MFFLQGFGSHRHTQGDPLRIAALRAEQLAAITARLGIGTAGGGSDSAEAALRRHLAGTGKPYLWIVDDLPGGIDAQVCASLLAPTPNGRTLVTTRNDVRYPWGRELRLSELDGTSAVDLLTSRRPVTGTGDRLAAQRLASDLGHHALGLTVAAGLSEDPGFAGYEQLRAGIGSTRQDVLAQPAALLDGLPGDHAAGIAGTILRSISRLGPAGRDTLRAASLLTPAPVPQHLLTAIVAGAGTTRAAARSGAELAAGLREAAGRSLADAATSADGQVLWTVHALVSRTVRLTDLDLSGRESMRAAAVSAVTSLLERTQVTYSRRDTRHVVAHVPSLVSGLADGAEQHMMNEAGRVHIELGDAEAALKAFGELHAACQAALGASDPTTLSVLGGLAVEHGLAGDHNTALALKLRAHEGIRAALGPDHPDTLTLLSNIGVTYSDIGDHAAALEVCTEVYQSRLRLLQAHHPDTLAAMSNLAITAGRSGDHARACRLKSEACERSRRIHGPDHPLTLDAMESLAASEAALGHTATAHRLFSRVHQARRELLGDDHPATLSTQENAAVTTGDDAQTQAILTGIYQARIGGSGPQSPGSQKTLRSLLTAYRRQLSQQVPAPVPRTELAPYPLPVGVEIGEARLDDLVMDERVSTFELAAAVHESMVGLHGPGHVETLLCGCLLAHATAALNQLDRQFEDALVIAQDSLTGLTEELGPHDPRTRLARRLTEWIDQLTRSSD